METVHRAQHTTHRQGRGASVEGDDTSFYNNLFNSALTMCATGIDAPIWQRLAAAASSNMVER